ncbi:probable ATP-dependent DNA helicase HFM1 [Zerene cesonia]|uniref:probable ATP-dependent DNA helicase HFM1 n=1 Tax=Zerene cesonia TaxID=33412 RepID=UPI0018E5798E|nr:probable ATP-dependent DNA helicase HFM1 [Zerene cesonia]
MVFLAIKRCHQKLLQYFRSNFTDILNEEIENSQPMSLPLSNSTNVSSQENFNVDLVLSDKKRPDRYTGQKGHFRSREEIDQKYRNVFTYNYFNLVQSRIIDDALYSDKSLVVCAPTGSGKTVVFEMAIVQLLMEMEDKNSDQDFKIIYMAPVKALCSERLSEWYPKFTKLGVLCIEVTGDTDLDFPQLKPYRLIITTPEKWDMLTRRWKDHASFVEVIKLFLIDEVHILNDEMRGPVLEAVVSRMKTIESSAQSAHRITKLQQQYRTNGDTVTIAPSPKIRFIAVSATVSNPEDVAKWLGSADKPAVFYKFGDECRPVKLKLVVEGYPCAEGSSLFKFDIVLNYKLWPIIQKYYNGKPTLIFCNTRKSVALTAETLSREITVGFSDEQKARLAALASTIKNKKFQSLILCGVGCHHAGLLYEERINIENAFRNRELPILITTTTLAMGVNLPAHLVIIKNTQQYVNGAYQEYSISTILQMVGRAGRPQFDTEATAVIMTRLADKARYQSLVGGSDPLQSYLHKRLAENLNSEAALGTVTDVAQCVQWVNSTFLSVRAARDPRRYLGLPTNASQQLISKKIEELCVKAMNGLASAGLITMDEASCIVSTEAGRLMSVYYIDLGTMKTIMKIDGTESLERLLWLVCESHELSDMHLRVDERRCLNSLNRNNSAATIRFPMKGKINSRQMKLYCIIQAVLGCLPIPEPSLNQEAMKIMRIADRVCKCLVAYVTNTKLMSTNPKNYTAVLNALVLAKCISAHLWENSPFLSKQLRGIGPTFSSLLASAGKVNFMLLEESHPRDLERIMNKGPPAGNILRKQISLLPKYSLNIKPINEHSIRIELQLLNHAFLSENIEQLTAGDTHKFYLIVGDSENNLLHMSSFKDTDLINLYDGCITCDVTRKQNNEHKVMAHCISSNFVGIDDHCEYVFSELPTCSHTKNNLKIDKSQVVENEVCVEETSKDRKRKNDTHIVLSKEKIKRDSNIIKQFKHLKESLVLTSENISRNLNETKELSNKILSDLKKTGNNSIETITSLPIIEQTPHQNVIVEISDEEDYIDDTEINNILNEIEGEIKQVTANNKVIQHEIQIKPTEKIRGLSNGSNNIRINKSSKLCRESQDINSPSPNIVREDVLNIANQVDNSAADIIIHHGKQSEHNGGSCLSQNLLLNRNIENLNFQESLSKTHEINLDSLKSTFESPSFINKHSDTNRIKDICEFSSNKLKSLNATRKSNPDLNYAIPNNSLIPLTTLIQQRDELHEVSCGSKSIAIKNEHNKNNNPLISELSSENTTATMHNDITNLEHDDSCKRKTHFYTNDNKFEQYIKKFSYSTSNINTCTKILPECRIQIISQLKVDLNVTEIKTLNDNYQNRKNTSPSLDSNASKIVITEIISPKQSQKFEMNDENQQIVHEEIALPQLQYDIKNILSDSVEDSKTNNDKINEK